MSTLPVPTSEAQYGYVVGRVIRAIADGVDADDKPDVQAASGSVTFLPKARLGRTSDYSAFVAREPLICPLDGQGFLTSQIEQYVVLTVGVYDVSFQLGAGASIPSFSVEVTAAHTQAAPLDLVTAAPYSPPAGAVVQTMPVPAGAEVGQVLSWTAAGLGWSDEDVSSVNGKTGSVTLDAADVSAEPAGTMDTHIQDTDPHPQYVTAAEFDAHTHTASQISDSTATGRTLITNANIDAKGDLIVGSANDTVTRLPAGVDGSILIADSNAATGIAYQNPIPLLRNLVANSDFSNGTTGWNSNHSTNAVSDGILTNTASGGDRFPVIVQTLGAALVPGNAYYIRARARVTNSVCTGISVYDGSKVVKIVNNPTQNEWYNGSAKITWQGSGKTYLYHTYGSTANATGAVMEVGKYLLIDLTACFGAGNEPSKEEMDAIMETWGGWFSKETPKLLPTYLSGYARATQTINAQTGTSYTLQASDAGNLATLTNSAAITVTIPPNVFAAGQRVDLLVTGAGKATIAAGAGMTVNGTPSLVSRARYSALTILFLSATTAVVVGDLATP